jgi:CheY-like chemotaxis protein
MAGRQALIVASSPFEAPYLAERLAGVGIKVQLADSETAALAVLMGSVPDAGLPDIVIVDCALGADETKRLGAAARAAGIARTLVLFSPFERRAFGQATMQGFDGWLVKPVRSRSLFARFAQRPEEPLNGDAHGAARRRNPNSGQLSRYEILLAEDNDINALLATRHLERLGGHVTRCADGLTAASVAAAAIAGTRPRFDVIFLDIRMPGQDGFAVARQIRQAERRAGATRTPLVALTADHLDAQRNRAVEAGIDEVLTKPLDLRRISRVLEQLTAAQSAA